MKKRSSIFIIFSLVFVNYSLGQVEYFDKIPVRNNERLTPEKKQDKSYWADSLSKKEEKDFLNRLTRKDSLRYIGIKHIHELKTGVLFVRLQSSQKQINLFKKAGNHNKAKEYIKERNEYIDSVRKGMRKHFTFCPYFFYYSHDTKEILKGNYENKLMDSNLDTLKNLDSLKSVNTQSDSYKTPQKRRIYYMATKSLYLEGFQDEIMGFAVLDYKLDQLKEPFPYHVRKRQGIFIVRRSYVDMAKEMNDRLHHFYKNYHRLD